jgi:hypothetical protein
MLDEVRGQPEELAASAVDDGTCRSLVTSMIPWLMFSSVSCSCSALSLAPASVRKIRSTEKRMISVSAAAASTSTWRSAHELL